ncbi:DUF2515 domain-containing protein [Brevibacillus panacihumi]|uniref:DUF2515 domain-containing protein n=1 Tax=Brevibacillus panacihumi TaxID=497735 RepID=UPI003D19AC59
MGIPLKQLGVQFKIGRELNKKVRLRAKRAVDQSELPQSDQQLIQQIKECTRQRNKNNVTRTTAYYEYYRSHPEIHWAFLGHMVSRNGGWNMTDLKGELLSRLLSNTEQNDFFQFLERGNWLIFQDVYPQFLLYEESLKREMNLFHLLPFFHVSVFMEVIWNHFWLTGDRYLLAMGLIINEQSYLEERIIKNPYYQKTVLQTLEFKLQDVLRLNQILFPCYREGDRELTLVGHTIQHFASLYERIRLGKQLYTLLFDRTAILREAVKWAAEHPHTGSRKDYWPHLFNDVKETMPGVLYRKRTVNGRLKPGTSRLFSPPLQHAWKDVDHPEAEAGDWCEDWKAITYFFHVEENIDGEIMDDYCKTLEKIELAVMAQSAIRQD